MCTCIVAVKGTYSTRMFVRQSGHTQPQMLHNSGHTFWDAVWRMYTEAKHTMQSLREHSKRLSHKQDYTHHLAALYQLTQSQY